MNGGAMISCPQCHNSMAFDVSLAGRSVACPHCSYTFQMPSPAAAPAMATPVTAAAMPTYSSVAAARFRPSTSIWDVFDFKFEKYLTPWIVRVTWVAALIVTGLMVSLFTLTAATGPLFSQRPGSEPQSRLAIERLLPNAPVPADQDGMDLGLLDKSVRLLAWVSFVLSALVSLLWIRVLLEVMIVLFNMATSLASIDRKMK